MYGIVTKEIAVSMNQFDKIGFVDDAAIQALDGTEVLGKTSELRVIGEEFTHAVVAIGNPAVRLSLLQKVEECSNCQVASIISPMAYISPSATIGKGCIIEPMAVVHTGCIVEKGCILSAGAVVNHMSRLCEGVHVDCNGTVVGNVTVPSSTKISSGEVYRNVPTPIRPVVQEGKEYSFEDGM